MCILVAGPNRGFHILCSFLLHAQKKVTKEKGSHKSFSGLSFWQLSTHYNSLTGFAQTVMLTNTNRFTAVKMLILFQKRFEGIVHLRAILLLFSLNELHVLQRSGDKSQKCANWMALGPMRAKECRVTKPFSWIFGRLFFSTFFCRTKESTRIKSDQFRPEHKNSLCDIYYICAILIRIFVFIN